MIKRLVTDLEAHVDLLSLTLSNKAPIKIDNGEYEGDLVSGLREGNGKMKWDNQNEYIGKWIRNEPNGFGKSNWQDGSSYLGHSKNNIKEGAGIYI